MTKKEIADEVSKRTGVEKNVTSILIDETIDIIRENLCSGKKIFIRGLFTLAPVKRAEKIGQDIQQNKPIVVPARWVPKAKFSKYVLHRMQKLSLDD